MSCGLRVRVHDSTYYWYEFTRGADVLYEMSLRLLMPTRALVALGYTVTEDHAVMVHLGEAGYACVRARAGSALRDGRMCAVFDVYPLEYVVSTDQYEVCGDAMLAVPAHELDRAVSERFKTRCDDLLYRCTTNSRGGDAEGYILSFKT
jgi:hypothetical protein